MNRLYKTESAVSNIVGSRIRFSIVTFFRDNLYGDISMK